ARRENDQVNGSQGTKPNSAVAEKEHRVSDVGPDERDESWKDRSSPEYGAPAIVQPRRGFFDIYKPGQGHNTRVWSGVGMGALVCWFAYFVYEKLSVVETTPTMRLVRVAIPVGLIIVFGLLGYWLLALNRKVCDFLIQTEGEMKKVNWTTRKDIIGSTKVVIFVVISLGVILTVVDVGFTWVFRAIGVLK
ncbi:MAG TPA: preprotein translocase subunit SecE, partial [Phycisphaerae bacterium]|nr:preprotein translocase subunit SecE [Phycisphaerae bacterium]